MHKKIFNSLLIILLCSNNLWANNPFNWNEKIEYIGFIKSNDVVLIDSIGTYSIEKIIGDNVYFNLNQRQFNKIKSLDINIYQDNRKSSTSTQIITMASSVEQMSNWDAYPTYETYLAMMDNFKTNYPQLCKIDTIGYSINNRLILAAKISNNVQENESNPEFFYSSSMHGDEVTGSIITLRLIDYLLKEYGNNDLVTKLIDSVEIYINPLSNPDGTYYGGNNNIANAIRRNANAIDLNRNFPDPKSGQNPDGNDHQPENIAMMNYINSRNFVLSMNFHGGEEVLNYPWDTWSKLHADNDWFYLISREFADTVHNHSTNYLTGFDNGVTNGYSWYSIDGGRQDYVNYFTCGREITFEITSTKLLDSKLLPDIWEYNYRSLLNYIKQVLYGIHGTVHDNFGNPILAKIEILNYDIDSSHVYSFEYGTFYRFLKSGTYNIQITAPYFDTLTINNFQVDDFKKQVINAKLTPTKYSITGIINDTLNNPVIANIHTVINGTDSIFYSNNLGFFNIELTEEEYNFMITASNYDTAYINNIDAFKYNNQIIPIKLYPQDSPGFYRIIGTTTSNNGNYLSTNIKVESNLMDTSTTSDNDGNFSLFIKEGLYNISFSAIGYDTIHMNNISARDYKKHELNVKLNASQYNIIGIVTDSTNTPLITKIDINNDTSIYTKSDGKFSITLTNGIYNFVISKEYYDTIFVANIDARQVHNQILHYKLISDDTTIKSNNTFPFKIYPNPSTGEINIEPIDYIDLFNIKIISSEGKLVMKSIVTENKITINNLSCGIYIIQIFNNSALYTHKIIVR